LNTQFIFSFLFALIIQGEFQLLIEALDDDLIGESFLDSIFVDEVLEVADGVTLAAQFTGDNEQVTVFASFNVECQENYYTDDCSVFCLAQNSNQTGFYTCNEDDGSRICLTDYYGVNCTTFCRESSDPVGGFYTCNENDGSRICRVGFSDPQTFCTRSKWIWDGVWGVAGSNLVKEGLDFVTIDLWYYAYF
jgi:hypothetical protein